MERIKITNNFYLDEFIPKELYKSTPIWKLKLCIDSRLFIIAQTIRDHMGPLTINNWATGGPREWSGVRTVDSPYYSMFSQHTYGRALDIISSEHTGEALRQHIRDNYDSIYRKLGVTRIEADTSWLHIDVGYTGSDKLI